MQNFTNLRPLKGRLLFIVLTIFVFAGVLNAEKSKQSVSLVNCQGAVRRILEVANFDKLFQLR